MASGAADGIGDGAAADADAENEAFSPGDGISYPENVLCKPLNGVNSPWNEESSRIYRVFLT
jgi:hypothetical protein